MDDFGTFFEMCSDLLHSEMGLPKTRSGEHSAHGQRKQGAFFPAYQAMLKVVHVDATTFQSLCPFFKTSNLGTSMPVVIAACRLVEGRSIDQLALPGDQRLRKGGLRLQFGAGKRCSSLLRRGLCANLGFCAEVCAET
jgi:hypothetical protein